MKRVTINIASYRSDGTLIEQAERERVRDYVLRRLSELYGGASAQEGLGSWVDDNGKLVTEPNIFVWSFADDVDQAQVERIGHVVRHELSQDAVMVAVEDGATVSFV